MISRHPPCVSCTVDTGTASLRSHVTLVLWAKGSGAFVLPSGASFHGSGAFFPRGRLRRRRLDMFQRMLPGKRRRLAATVATQHTDDVEEVIVVPDSLSLGPSGLEDSQGVVHIDTSPQPCVVSCRAVAFIGL